VAQGLNRVDLNTMYGGNNNIISGFAKLMYKIHNGKGLSRSPTTKTSKKKEIMKITMNFLLKFKTAILLNRCCQIGFKIYFNL
jgi:hypothetical protein